MSVKEAIRLLLNVSWKQAQIIQEQYGGLSESKDRSDEAKKEKNIDVFLPQGTRDLQKPHKKYLRKRGFDPKELEQIWNIKGTGSLGRYSHRIIAPIYFNKILVSYQGRDITDKADLKYKACSIEKERIHHKYIGYGYDLTNKKECLVVEGVFDAWRMGAGSVALFGTGYTPQQVQFLSTFKRVFVLFDSGEEEAQKNGYKLSFELQELGVESEQIILDYEGDPAELSQKEADYIMRELLLR